MKYEDIECLAFPLPEVIEKEKWCGRFDRARAMIKRRLDDEAELSALKKRLILELNLSLIHISEPTRQAEISYAVFCLKKKKKKKKKASSKLGVSAVHSPRHQGRQ